MLNSFHGYKVPIGISLCLLGVSLGNFLRVLTGVNLVIPFMIVAIFCLVDFQNLLRFRFPNMSKGICLLLISQVLIVLYMFASDYKETEVGKNVFLYYSVLLVIAIASLPKKYPDKLIKCFYAFSLVNALMACYLFFNGFGGMASGNVDKDYLNSLEETGKAMIFLYPSAGVTHTMATLALLKDSVIKNKFLRIFLILFLFVDFTLIISSGKRTVVLVFVLYILYYLWNERLFSSLKRFVKFIPLLVLLLILMKITSSSLPFLGDFVDEFFDHLQRGIDTLFGLDASNYDESAAQRVEIRGKAADIYNKDFTSINYIFGKGYMTFYMDQPLLQCVFDMGVVGLFVYVYNVIIVSVRHLIKKTDNSVYFLFKLGCINIVLTCLTAGTPYGYSMYCPILFLLYAYNIKNISPNVPK